MTEEEKWTILMVAAESTNPTVISKLEELAVYVMLAETDEVIACKKAWQDFVEVFGADE